MKSERVLDALGQVSGKYIEEAAPAARTGKMPKWLKWGAAAACFLIVAIGAVALFGQNGIGSHAVLQWSNTFRPEDYFKYRSADADVAYHGSAIADSDLPYAQSRFFSDKRAQFEADGIILVMEDHPLFDCIANYNSNGSLFDVELSWSRRGERAEYSDLKIVAGQQKVELIEDCIYIEIDEHGNIVEPAVTVTNRDGVQIVAECRGDQQKIITFQNESGWYQITGSWGDDYDSVVLLLDWIWEHPLDFTQFSMDAGDNYTYTAISEHPDAFAEYLPDFEAYGFYEAETSLTLKNGVPVSFEGHYAAHADKELIEADNYYDVPGYTKMHWCFETEPDVYDLERCVGDLNELTEQTVLDVLAKESSIAFNWEDNVVIIYPDSPYEAWELIASLQS